MRRRKHVPDSGRTHATHYASVTDMVAACDASYHSGKRYWNLFKPKWIGRRFHDWSEITSAATREWPDGIDTVARMVRELADHIRELPPPKDRKRKRCFSEDGGDEFDHDRLRAGQADFWVRNQRQEVRAPQHVALLTSVATPYYQKADDILWRGAAAVVLTDLLETAGYRVELYAVRRDTDAWTNDDGCFISLALKDAGTPLDVAAVVNGVSGWFFRTLFLQEPFGRVGATPTSFLGRPQPVGVNSPEVDELVGRGASKIVIDDVWSETEACQFVRTTIEKLNAGALTSPNRLYNHYTGDVSYHLQPRDP